MKIKCHNGFTLIEVMVVVAIISILAAIAYPSYSSSVIKGKRAQGRAALAELLQQEERYMTQRNCYLGFSTSSNFVATASAPSPSTDCGGLTATSVPLKTFSGDNTSNAAYILTADTCPNGSGGTLAISECVRVNAVPIVSDTEVNTLWMTSTGSKGCTGTSSATLCWP